MSCGRSKSLGLSTVIAALLLLAQAQIGSAAPIFSTLAGPQGVASFGVAVSYTAATDELKAESSGMHLITLDGVTQDLVTNPGFDLTASINASGILAGGALTISGTVASLGYASGTILTGDVVAVGFPDGGGDPLQFLVNVTGGDAYNMGDYPSEAGIILTFAAFPGDFSSDWANNPDLGNGLTSTIPEPTTAVLLGLGLAVLARRARSI